ncbi:MAG: hypothetical protein A2821_03145 [Candidatus Magasanikbacteria bacterium RIFCSPHIGHO2_01_FULL_41_23]|uniref:Spore coat biosynthesis protein F n=1 Tax=Candidatus Magasanikbacteria bacterium RIFCSPLOWO2_01_FULL_40_15 TaxID=1798686 RepID=A0A1F6N389_9BACT|nr:MAG: hypothetical protein A2821_03145 [Candidatus Magasanikbacteria bacterium RIFCSPHIGHO2_01_FULL_41_23]OGH67334.1 MAG: hypothetical protein A3C66_01160 [Candidatus Magasanikbacteria bacterium RIFCSPHIGHO2_02_FULL_41_35]OGH76559.1 MAG: hypothetical protein A3F22_00370 [Candidatus Magasanikbacteria bacterium RIFCSPHIGHO2_12_FULL_41_16]OGH78456.1 MAG: hypothetical protein A2983_02985 [Candidatus Magasanikbacteria bacterium RIFCSPLOWO2_01_FULL_40_15]
MYQKFPQKIVATIEARMTSSRLPGKVMLPLAGKPSTERLIERLKRSAYIDEIIIATTVNVADDILEELANCLRVKCFRGSEEDVLGRVLAAAEANKAEIIVEVTGDCPLVDHRLIDRGIEEFFNRKIDYASNIIPVTFPIGFDVQVFPTKVLAEVARLTTDPVDRVHVSYYIYNHPEQYRLYNWSAEGEYYWPELRVTLDEKADYELLKIIFERLLPINEDFTALEVIKFLRANPKLLDINKHVRQKEIDEE